MMHAWLACVCVHEAGAAVFPLAAMGFYLARVNVGVQYAWHDLGRARGSDNPEGRRIGLYSV